MTKPYTMDDLSSLFDEDISWRRKELSDIKSAIKQADSIAKSGLLKALVAISYSHWEGYVRHCATAYFEFLTLRRRPYSDYERQIYINSFLVRIDALSRERVPLQRKVDLINDIIDGVAGSFRYCNPALIDTKSNLNCDVIKEICIVCAVDGSIFEDNRDFIDKRMLKRRNAIAHGQQEIISEDEMNEFVAKVLNLMQNFRSLLENKVYSRSYAA